MISFKQFIINEQLLTSLKKRIYGGEKSFHWFDMDDTLVHHDPQKGAKIHVKDENGNRIKTLTTSEYNTFTKNNQLKPGHSYDYNEFVDPRVFASSAHPIRKMIHHAQNLLDNGHHVHIITARSDMDNPEIMLGALKQMGLNTSHPNFHLDRAGNFGKNPTHVNKALMLHKVLSEPRFGLSRVKKVVGYDDHKPNVVDIHGVPIENDKSIEELHPNVNFTGVHFHNNKVKQVYSTGR